MGPVVAHAMAPSKAPTLSDTAIAGCCKVCAEPEEQGKRFLICGHSLCMYRYYHIKCMSPDQIASDPQMGEPRWYCPSCLCRTCFCDVDDNKIILCDGCDEAYHLYCLDPRRTSVPKGKWYCKPCVGARAREREAWRYEKKMLKLHRKRNGAMVKSNKYMGLELLLSVVDKMTADEEAEAEKLRRDQEAAAGAEKTDEEAAAGAEKMDEDLATVAE